MHLHFRNFLLSSNLLMSTNMEDLVSEILSLSFLAFYMQSDD